MPVWREEIKPFRVHMVFEINRPTCKFSCVVSLPSCNFGHLWIERCQRIIGSFRLESQDQTAALVLASAPLHISEYLHLVQLPSLADKDQEVSQHPPRRVFVVRGISKTDEPKPWRTGIKKPIFEITKWCDSPCSLQFLGIDFDRVSLERSVFPCKKEAMLSGIYRTAPL